MTDLDLTNDLIDVRDIIARIEDIENDDDKRGETTKLMAIMSDLDGAGGDEQWRGDWYPITLIRDSHFTDYARELLEDIGDLPRELPHYIEIDWDATARNIRVDYTPVTINGFTYWTR